ncbi:hypothetical protein VNO77_31308 [Canavalia gladiata]|uniref:Uncharacterized protein n=1 Tax=Canavalia gladiata TaxID=3824 RepID=A0AAN9KPK4_CANGL
MAAAATTSAPQEEDDIQTTLTADVHLGTRNCDLQIECHVLKRRADSIYIFNLGRSSSLLLGDTVAIKNAQDITVQFARPHGQRAVLKFSLMLMLLKGESTPRTSSMLKVAEVRPSSNRECLGRRTLFCNFR